ncbi:MAG: cupredoxin domain-containing protein [Actinobacteria bacterium]|nr:cupredoxin domain-containing protein [Actinomycetota bacterium]
MSHQPLSEEVRFRVPLPFAIPIAALVVIAAVTIGMSRILLSVPKEAAVIIAIAVAMNVLIAAAVIANRPETAKSSWVELLIVFTYPILIGFVLAQMNLGGDTHAAAEESGAHAAAEGEGGGGGLSISAQNLEFSSDTITLPAGEEAELEFANEDATSVPHNVAIYEEQGGDELFIGEVIPGGQSITYAIDPLKKGKYYFQCDVHPGMNGTVTVE